MTLPIKFPPVLVWQHRALGVFWTLIGLACIYDLLARDYWQRQKLGWLPVLVGLVYCGTGVGFFMACRWARWIMWALMIFAAFEFLQFLALGLFEGSSGFGWCGLAGLAMTAYTVVLLIVSARNRKPKHES